ncbi:MAG: glycosyltransferase family 2 protein [bacterium]|nr:glycosyltransferase family 2 protein [bacterium]
MNNNGSQCENIFNCKTDLLVSIITPIFNGAKYLEHCIQSILSQSYPYIEHIFIDGNSSDGTVEILASYAVRYSDRVRFISESDKGSGDAWNKGLRMARGEIFGELGSDDMSEPGAIQAVVDFFRLNQDAYFVFGICNYINEKGEIIMKGQAKDFDLEEIINEGCYVPTSASFYRREVIERVGMYDTLGNDLDYLIRVAKAFPIHQIKKTLSNFRIHKESATTGSKKEIRKMWLREDCLVSRRHGGRFFSGYCKRYYEFVITERLQAILGRNHLLIEETLRCLRMMRII